MFTKKTFRSILALMLCIIMVGAVLPVSASSKLDAPDLKKAEAKGEGIRVSWHSVSGAVSYKVYRKTKDSDWQKIATVEKTHYQDNTAEAGVKYTYTVKAVDADGKNGSYDHTGVSAKWKKEKKAEEPVNEEIPEIKVIQEEAEEPSDEPVANAPSKPVLHNPTVKANGVLVKWDTSAGAVKYKILRKNSEKGKWKTIKTVNDATATSYLDKSAKSDTTYWYSVRGVDADGNKGKYDKTGKKVTFYAAPKLKKAKSVSKGIQVSWEAVTGAPAYRVYRKTAGGKWKKIAVTTSTSYTDTAIPMGVEYWYTVRVVSKDNKKKLSDSDHTGLKAVFVGHAEIKNLSVHAGYISATTGVYHKGYVRAEWDAVPGAALYGVYHKTGDGKWISLATVADTFYEDFTVVNNTTYTFRIKAKDAAGNVIGSYDASGKTITFYAAPTLTDCVRYGEALKTTWEPVEGVSYYEVRRKIVAGGSWITMGIVNSTEYIDTTMPSGTRCWYTVRCAKSDGTVISAEDPTGVNNTSYMDRPILEKAVPSAGGVTFTWQAVDKAENYHVYRKDGERSEWVSLGTTGSAATTYFDATAVNGTIYYYTVATCDAADTEDLSLYNEAGVMVTYYKRPALKTLENTSSGAKFTWGKVDGIGYYNVYRKTGNEAWTKIATVNDNVYTDSNVLSTGSYTYTVSCVKDGAEVSAYDAIGLNTVFFWNPALAAEPSASALNVSFAWYAVDGISTYQIDRKMGDADWINGYDIITAKTEKITYTDTGVASGKTYTYRIRCVDDGAVVSGATVTKSIRFLEAPAVFLSSTTTGKVKVTWTTSKGADGYEIWRKKGATGSYSRVATISGGSKDTWYDKDLTSKANYYYYAVAVYGDSKSANGPADYVEVK